MCVFRGKSIVEKSKLLNNSSQDMLCAKTEHVPNGKYWIKSLKSQYKTI